MTGYNTKYWAAEEDPKKLIQGLNKARDNCWATLESRGLPNLWRMIIRDLEGHRGTGSLEKGFTYANEAGKEDTLRFRVNLMPQAVLQKAQLAQGKNKTKFKCLSVNSDSTTMVNNLIAQKAMDYVFRSIRLDEISCRGLMNDITYGANAYWIKWDVDLGEKVSIRQPVMGPNGPVMEPGGIDMQTGQPLPPKPAMETVKKRSGSPVIHPLPPTQVMRDYTVRDSLWYIVQEPISKWELMAQYPELADEICNVKSSRTQELVMSGFQSASWNEDTVVLHHFYHADTKAVPGGRWVGWVGETLLWSVEMPTTDHPPVVWLSTLQISGTHLPYPEISDLLGPQIALNEAYTLVAEEMIRLNRANLAAKKGSVYNVDAMSQGGHVIEVDDLRTDLPVYLSKPPIGQAPQLIIENMPRLITQVAGLNEVAQGNPSSNITSGTFAALMVNTAENNQGLRSDAHVSSQEALGNIVLDFMSKNIPNGFLADISGTIDSPYLTVLNADTFQGIHRIQVIRDSKIAESWPARMEMAQQIFQLQKPDDRAAAIEMLTTGNLEPITRQYTAAQTLISQENERILSGDLEVEPSITDDPHMHVLGHLPTLGAIRMMPEGPEKSATMLAALTHISKHGAVFQGADPTILQILQLPMPNINGVEDEAKRLSGEGASVSAPQDLPAEPQPAEPPPELSENLK